METIFSFADDLGFAKVVHIYDPPTGLKAIVSIDNTTRGPAFGGIRMAEDLTALEVMRLSRAMTFKNAAADIPYGGGKSGIIADPKLPLGEKEKLMRAFAKAIRNLTDYIPAPDMGINEQCMAWIYSEIGRAAGLPATMGGIPMDEIGATGWGLSAATEVASKYAKFSLYGATMVIQGFGSVGQSAARFLGEKGVKLVGATDSQGTLYYPQGIDVEKLIALKAQGKSVVEFPIGTKLDQDEVIDIECDIWIPAARPDVVRLDNVARLKTRLVVQGANIPFTPEAEIMCQAKGMVIVPDFIANAGGVICGSVEHQGGTKEDALDTIAEKIRHNTTLVLERVKATEMSPRQAAMELAKERLVSTQMVHT